MVEVKVESDVVEKNLMVCAAKIFCCFCGEVSSVKKYGGTKKDGSKGKLRWIVSNFETHLNLCHVARFSKRSSQLSEESSIKSYFLPSKPDVINQSKSASEEEQTRKCQELILLDETKSSSVKETNGAENTEIKYLRNLNGN